MNSVICKSTFLIQPFYKKLISVGYLITNENLSIAVCLECNISRKYLIINKLKWDLLFSETIYDSIMNDLVQCNGKQVKFNDNFSYKINTKTESISLRNGDNHITLSRHDLYRLRQLLNCINANITEKLNKINVYQSNFDSVYKTLQNDILRLPVECIRTDFVNQYIQDYQFNLNDTSDEDKSFIYELHQLHYEQLSEIIINSKTE